MRFILYSEPVTRTVVMFRCPPVVAHPLCPEICSTHSPLCEPSVLYVRPGDISAYGTGSSAPAHSSAISIRREASIVAVRLGMERQYGKRLSVHRPGRPYEP